VIAAFVSAALPAARLIGGCFLIYIGMRIVWPSLKKTIIGSARRARPESGFGLIGEIDQPGECSASTTLVPTADENRTAVAACELFSFSLPADNQTLLRSWDKLCKCTYCLRLRFMVSGKALTRVALAVDGTLVIRD